MSGARRARRPAPRRRAGPAGACRAAAALVAFVMLILFGPVLMLALFSFNDSSIISLPWEGFTTRWYEEAWDNDQARDAVLNSLSSPRSSPCSRWCSGRSPPGG